MASVTGTLPKFLRWIFTVLVGLATFAAVCMCIFMLVDPHVPADAHFGPLSVDLGAAGQPAVVQLRPVGGDFDFQMTAFHGTITFFIAKAGGLFETMKRYGGPMWLLHILFLIALFELLRRLFRNVGRGDSFSQGTVRLVQMIAGLLIVSSFILAFAQDLFAQAMLDYLVHHAQITVSGTEIHFPQSHIAIFPRRGLPFNGAMFCYGLLVLALSEVFRQGLVLKRENDLTI